MFKLLIKLINHRQTRYPRAHECYGGKHSPYVTTHMMGRMQSEVNVNVSYHGLLEAFRARAHRSQGAAGMMLRCPDSPLGTGVVLVVL